MLNKDNNTHQGHLSEFIISNS